MDANAQFSELFSTNDFGQLSHQQASALISVHYLSGQCNNSSHCVDSEVNFFTMSHQVTLQDKIYHYSSGQIYFFITITKEPFSAQIVKRFVDPTHPHITLVMFY